jgi:hypothetical protein
LVKTEGVNKKKAWGLGFKDLQSLNLAMLAKIGWRVLHDGGSLLARVLHDKYFTGKSLLDAELGRRPSWGWRGILQGRQILCAGLRWRIGTGQSVGIRDPWLPIPYTFRTSSRHIGLPARVVDLIDMDRHCWNITLVEQFFPPAEISLFHNLAFESFWLSR